MNGRLLSGEEIKCLSDLQKDNENSRERYKTLDGNNASFGCAQVLIISIISPSHHRLAVGAG